MTSEVTVERCGICKNIEMDYSVIGFYMRGGYSGQTFWEENYPELNLKGDVLLCDLCSNQVRDKYYETEDNKHGYFMHSIESKEARALPIPK